MNTGTVPKGIAEEIRLTEEDQKAIAAYINSPTEDGYVVHAKPAKTIVEKLFKLSLTLNHLLEQHLEENERITKENAHHEQRMKDNHTQAVKNAIVIDELREELERVKMQSSIADGDVQNLSIQLAAKDKELEWYASKGVICRPGEDWDVGYRARSILSQYAKEGDTNDEIDKTN